MTHKSKLRTIFFKFRDYLTTLRKLGNASEMRSYRKLMKKLTINVVLMSVCPSIPRTYIFCRIVEFYYQIANMESKLFENYIKTKTL